MAISTQRRLDQLKAECGKLGLTVVQSGKRESKTDYILALREYYLEHNYPDGVPQSLQLMLQIESPMLCNRINQLTPEKQEEIWDSPNWIAEQKEDGVRMVSFFMENKFDAYSRNISVEDFLPVNYGNNIYLGEADIKGLEDDFIADCELVSSNPNISTIMGKRGVVCETQLQACSALLAMNSDASLEIQTKEDCPLEFRVFDILWWNGEWIIDKPLIERIPYVLKAVEQLQKAGVKARRPYSAYTNKRVFYKAMLSIGAEGCVLKNLKSPYIATSSRSKEGFIKVKRTMSQAMRQDGIADGIDAFVTGFEPADEKKSWAGLVGALEFSVFLPQESGDPVQHKIARITNIPMDLREKITEHDKNGNPILKAEWYGKVATVDGQCISARSKRLKHAVLVDWRPDRSPDTCVMDEEYMNSMIL